MKRIWLSVFEAWDTYYTTEQQEDMWRSARRTFFWTLGVGLAIVASLFWAFLR